MDKQLESKQTTFSPTAKKIGLGICAGLLVTSLSAGVLAANQHRRRTSSPGRETEATAVP